MGEDAFQVFLMLLGELEVLDKIFYRLESCKDCIFSTERVLPEEDLKGGLLFVLVLNEIRIRTSELIQVVVEKVDRSDRLGNVHWRFSLLMYLIIGLINNRLFI